MTLMYDILPECRALRCDLRAWKEDESPSWFFIFRHGENPEAVRRINLDDDDAADQMRAFARQCHQYEGALIGYTDSIIE